MLDAASKNAQVTDTVEELERAYIGTRPYSPQPQRTKQAQVLKANPYEQARSQVAAQVKAGTLTDEQANILIDAISQKATAAKSKANAQILDNLTAAIAALP